MLREKLVCVLPGDMKLVLPITVLPATMVPAVPSNGFAVPTEKMPPAMATMVALVLVRSKLLGSICVAAVASVIFPALPVPGVADSLPLVPPLEFMLTPALVPVICMAPLSSVIAPPGAPLADDLVPVADPPTLDTKPVILILPMSKPLVVAVVSMSILPPLPVASVPELLPPLVKTFPLIVIDSGAMIVIEPPLPPAVVEVAVALALIPPVPTEMAPSILFKLTAIGAPPVPPVVAVMPPVDICESELMVTEPALPVAPDVLMVPVCTAAPAPKAGIAAVKGATGAPLTVRIPLKTVTVTGTGAEPSMVALVVSTGAEPLMVTLPPIAPPALMVPACTPP
jgi:hypothetical protein